MKQSDVLVNLLRDAMFKRATRKGQIRYIADLLGCSKIKAKELFFANAFRADETYLRSLLDRSS